MILFYGMHDNTLISHPSHLVAYQDGSKIWNLYKDISAFLGWNQTKKNDKTVVHVYP